MDRRTFLRTAGVSTGSVALGGCLGDDSEPVPEIGDGPPQYTPPTYSEFTPAETHTGGGVVFLHLRLAVFRAVQRAAEDGRLPEGPLVELPLLSVERVPDAVETLSSYPFAAALRRAVTDAAGGEDSANRTAVVDPLTAVGGNTTANETETDGENATIEESRQETAADSLGATVTDLTLTDDLLIFHGSYDRQLVADRYTEGFQRVDTQRGVEIYEGTGDRSGLAFAVSEELLVVPTETTRAEAAETLLAHTLSGYINGLGRVVDDKDGEWLFETTGSAALSIGVWGADDPLALSASSLGVEIDTADGSGPVFGAVDGFISAVELTVDDGGISNLEARFAGLFSESVPTEAELKTSLVNSEIATDIVRNPPRIHVATSFDDA